MDEATRITAVSRRPGGAVAVLREQATRWLIAIAVSAVAFDNGGGAGATPWSDEHDGGVLDRRTGARGSGNARGLPRKPPLSVGVPRVEHGDHALPLGRDHATELPDRILERARHLRGAGDTAPLPG